MDRTLAAVVLTALAGAIGAGGAVLFLGAGHVGGGGGPAGGAASNAELLAEVRALREEVQRLSQTSSPALAPRAGGATGNGDGASPTTDASPSVARAQREAEWKAVAKEAAAAAVAEWSEKHPTASLQKPAEKKAVTLAEAARELGLSASQEDEIRRIHAEGDERLMKVLAAPDGDVQAVRREIEEAKGDATKQMALGMKYLPKFLGNLPEMMSIEADRTSRIRKTLGPETYAKYQGYRVTDLDPLGFGGSSMSLGVGD